MQVLLLMATALNVPMTRPAPDAAGDPLSVELRSRQRCIAEITEMIHVSDFFPPLKPITLVFTHVCIPRAQCR